ncbi:MAG: Txe/YoeB family addiction module toxin [Bacteroidales bacterium]|nr:Txe/YoeB family addiction module toxin [Bacteroidales bacterium]
MMYVIEFSDSVKETLKKWKKSDPIKTKKVNKIVHDIAEHPRTGIGHPEPLVGGNDITWSRHITGKDRIIYDIHDDKVVVDIISVEGHYNDK